MSDQRRYDPRYEMPAVGSGPERKIVEFRPEVFTELESAEPLPDPAEDFSPRTASAPVAEADIFQEFQIGRKTLSEFMAEIPSLEGLFKPFDLASERPDEKFYDLAEINGPRVFDYEDMDVRDPAVVRTMAQAEAKSREIASRAEADGLKAVEAARVEAQGIIAEAVTRAGAEAVTHADRLRREAELALEEAGRRRAEAESQAAQTENLKTEAEKDRAEAAARLAAVRERIDGLDRERREMEAETEAKRLELDAEYQRLTAELEGRREEIWRSAGETGRQAGYEQGLNEGRAAGREEGLAPWREKTAVLADLSLRLENIYKDLWRVNGPMMVQLAIEAAGAVLNKELREAEDLTVRAFEACIGFLGQAHRVVFQVRPQDIPLLEEAKAEQRQRLGALVKVSFQPDETLGPGDLIMESDVGRLDATVKHRAAQAMDVLRAAFEGAAAAPPAPLAPPAPVVSEQASPEQASPAPTALAPTAPEQASLAPTAPEQASPEQVSPAPTAPEQALPEQASPAPTAPEQASPEQASPEQASPEQASPEQASPEQASPEQTAPEQTAPEQTASESATLAPTAPENKK